MLVFATSDKGGTGRTVTSCNILYRRALQGDDVCYLDFDFGSPTAGAVFQVTDLTQGTAKGGLHSYLQGTAALPHDVDVWAESDTESLRGRPSGVGRLVLYPGDIGGGEFPVTAEVIDRCVELLLRSQEEYEVCLVDLSAGRSYAIDAVLAATAHPALSGVVCRWLVYHRWTRQHIYAAANLVFGQRGLLEVGAARGHDPQRLRRSVRLVRTAVVDPNSEDLAGLRATQVAWLRDCNYGLQRLAGELRIGRSMVLGTVPFDPMLQWREQLISDDDVVLTQVANARTVAAFDRLAHRLSEEAAWQSL